MGTLTYDSKFTATIDDRILAHLQIVVWAKLRRGESFAFTWEESSRNGYGRSSIWLSSNISVVFEYFGGKPATINRAWVAALTKSANSPGGLRIVPEPSAGDPSGT